jgi:competence protein ComEC
MNFYSFCGLFSLIFVGFSFGMQIPPANQGMQVKIFNVGQGSCAVVTYPGQPTLLVDAGSDQLPAQKTTLIWQIATYLNQNSPHGISVLISHPEKDHAGWMQQIINQMNPGSVRNITVGGLKENYTKNSKFLSENWTSHILDSRDITNPNPTHLPSYCSLWHVGYGQQHTNDQSLIVCVEDQNFRVILPGDSGSKTFNQQTIVASPKLTYFVANHHGSEKEGANNSAVLQALAPDAIIVSSGMHGNYFHPTSSTLDTFAQTTRRTENERYINGQTAPNLIGDERNQALINYSNKFSVYRTCHPIFTTNSMGNITINSQGLFTSNACNTPIEPIYRSHFDHFNFNTIVRLFLTRAAVTDAHLNQLPSLPLALSYLDLEQNYISAHGVAKLIVLLQQRQAPSNNNTVLIKTSGNPIGKLKVVKPILQQASFQQQLTSCVKVLWDKPIAWMANSVDALHYNPSPITQQKKFPSKEGLVQHLENLNATRASSSFCWDYSELFVHTPEKTTWYDFNSLHSFEFNIPNVTAALRAKKSNSFLFTDGQSSIIYAQDCNKQYFYNTLPGRMPYAQPQNISSGTHISTGFATGNGLQELDNLRSNNGDCSYFEIAHPISDDGTAALTIENQTLNFWKKVGFQWILKQRYPYEKAIQYAGFNDLNRSILIKFSDGSEEQLSLALEAAST